MAREDRDGSGVEMEFMALSPEVFGEVCYWMQEY
jgi:hypothetical protein